MDDSSPKRNEAAVKAKPTTVLGSLWKHILETLIKLLWHLSGTHYSYSVAFITSALKQKSTPSINRHFNSMHKLYGDSDSRPTDHLGLLLPAINYLKGLQRQQKTFPFNATTP